MSSAASAAPAPLTGAKLAVTSIALALGTFMQVLDTTIANVSIPTIAGDLGASADQGTWVITSFAIANGIAVPLTGWLMGRYGAVKVFVASVLAFTAASLLCGLAWSLSGLVIFRILQGAVSGPLVPGSQALLLMIFPPQKRATALAIWSMTTLVAPIFGPILGGIISDNYHWAWIFLINVPVGLLCAFIVWRNLGDYETATRKLPIDKVGLVLLIVWVGALQLMLDTGKNDDWFSSNFIITLAIVSGIACAAWLVWEFTDKHPIVDVHLFAGRNFSLGTLAFCLGYALFFANIVILPLWLQTQEGYNATYAGLVAAPSGIVAVILTPLAARIMNRIDPRWSASFAFFMFAISFFMRANYTADASFYDFALPIAVQGVALSTYMVSMVTIAIQGLPPEKIPSASGIMNFARITGGGFAASLGVTLWDRREAFHQSRLAESSSMFDPAAREAMAILQNFGFTDTQAAGILVREMTAQAYLLASTEIFWASGWISLALIGLIWLSKRPVSQAPPIVVAD
ncbi:DHA2 family efflux MFS transporter permease subunit [Iodidimonas sp. SYSU 1G8]|uniref:DHA2 family efflux MFS transporter permease subunit n=1 Tax=Iodidimonas sp. SYSU 1G8 TaxID=3133967 RepID=UPI0031FEF403